MYESFSKAYKKNTGLIFVLYSSIILIAAVGFVLAACGSNKDKEHTDNGAAALSVSELEGLDPDKKYEEEFTIDCVRMTSSVFDDFVSDLYTPLLKEKFNIKINMTPIDGNQFDAKLSMMIASNQAPDLLFSLRKEHLLNERISTGKLVGFTEEETAKRLPNFLDTWTDEERENVYGNISYADGKLYYFPGKRPTNSNMAWMFRQDLLDELGITEYPKDLNELHELMLILKEHTNQIPYVAVAGTGTSPLWALTGFLQAFDLPELIIRTVSYVDPRTNEFYPYAFVNDNYRESLIYVNKLYNDELIWKDFATGTRGQAGKLMTQGNGHVLYGYPEKLESDYNSLSREYSKDAYWDWSRDMIGHDPQNGVFFKREPYFNADAIGFSSFTAPGKLNRTIDFVDWLFGEEGTVVHTYGFEGITYQLTGGHYRFTDAMKTPITSQGHEMWEYGVVISSPTMHADINRVYRPYLIEVEEAFFDRDKYYFHTEPIMDFTLDESRALADLETGINDVRDEYALWFITGQLDPSDDLSWERYLSTLDKIGLEEVKQIRTDAYERGKKEHGAEE